MKRGTGLKPMSAKRRDRLAAEGNLNPSSTLVTRTKATVKRPKDTGPDRATAELVAERDHYACVVCGEFLRGARGTSWAIHHRKLRAQGVDNCPSNLICVCTKCHTDIHAAPEKARQAGWMLRGTDSPALSVMTHSQYGWVTLTDQCGVKPISGAPDA